MAITGVATLGATRMHLTVRVTEDTNAQATLQYDIIAALTAAGVTDGPLYSLLANGGVAFGAQANARAAWYSQCKSLVIAETCATVTETPSLCIDPNIVGPGANNFRLDLLTGKTGAGNACTFIVTFRILHSILR